MFIKKSSLGTQQTYYNVFIQHFLQPTPWVVSLQYNVSFIANGVSRDTAGGASVYMDDDIIGKGQQEILTFYLIQSQYFHLVFCTLFIFKFIYKLDVTLSHILDTIKSLQDINQGTNKCQKESFKIKSTSCLCEEEGTFYFQTMLFSCGFTYKKQYIT